MSTPVTRAPDPRPARTKAALFAAARNLSVSGDEVTVSDLARHSGVSCSAFYTHYGSLDELLGEMLDQMFEAQEARAAALAVAGRSGHEIVQATAAGMAAYAVHHHAFIRGALGWKVRHGAYVSVVATCARLYEDVLRGMGNDLPPRVDIARTAQFLAGGTVQVLIDSLVETAPDARDGIALDSGTVLETLLRVLPSWFTGLPPADPIPAGLGDDLLTERDGVLGN